MQGISTVFTTAVLLIYGTVKNFHPVIPFLNLYLVNASNVENLTDETLYGQVYPFYTYSYLAMLIPVMLVTDWLRYKPVIVSEALGLVTTWSLLAWGNTVGQMQTMQAAFGYACAAEVAYYSYIYAAVSPAVYQKVTSLVRGATLFGRCCGYGFGQIIVLLNVRNALKLINYVNLGAVSTALFISLFIPGVAALRSMKKKTGSRKLVQSRSIVDQEAVGTSHSTKAVTNNANRNNFEFRTYFAELFSNLKISYSNKFVLKWSLWWAVSTCLWGQVGNYVQVLWSEVGAGDPTSQAYNGLTEVLNALLSASAVFCMQFVRIDWVSYGELCIGGLCCVQAFCLGFAGQSKTVVLVYVLYVTYCVLYQAAITVATYNVANKLDAACHGLIFGGNTFIALALQTTLTIVVVDHRGLNLTARKQFIVYAVVQACVAVLFLTMGFRTCWTSRFTKTLNFQQQQPADPHVSDYQPGVILPEIMEKSEKSTSSKNLHSTKKTTSRRTITSGNDSID